MYLGGWMRLPHLKAAFVILVTTHRCACDVRWCPHPCAAHYSYASNMPWVFMPAGCSCCS